jgi:NADH dehydrogenase
MSSPSTPHRVVIIGGGFAGVKCAKQLRRRLPADRLEVVVFNRENHMVFHPLLAEVAGATVNPDAVAAPLRQFLDHVDCRTESVTAIDLNTRQVVYEHHDGRSERLSYDHLVIACGRSVNLNAVPGMSDHAFALKTVGDAVQIRAHVIEQLEMAEVSVDEEARRSALSFIIVGGGFSGVEIAGEINDLVRDSLRFYPHIAASEVTVTLVHSGDQILPEVSANLRAFARREMERAGITVLTSVRAAAATRDGVWLKDGRQLKGRTIVCTIGTAPERLLDRLDAPKDRGALLTAPDMRVEGQSHVWAIGDCARIINAADQKPSPTTAQFAERQGRQAADNIVCAIDGEATKPFRHEPLGQLCAIGGRNAVAELGGFKMSGLLAWLFWRAVYLSKLPSWSRMIKLGADWAWELIFRRDLGTVKSETTSRVSHAFYRAGDYIFRQGEAAQHFYALEKGEVEVIRGTGGGDELVAVLRAGDFFGEMALLEGRPHGASVRARTDIEITVLGADLFSRLSKSLTPLQQRLADAVRRRSNNLWTRMPGAYQILAGESLVHFIEPAPAIVPVETTFDEALRTLATRRLDAIYAVDADQQLAGVLTRTDLYRAIDAIVTSPERLRDKVGITGFMSANPVAITTLASPADAAQLMWSRGLKSIPVVAGEHDRRVVGSIRAEAIMHAVSMRLAQANAAATTVTAIA